jgi:hypothetical protein
MIEPRFTLSDVLNRIESQSTFGSHESLLQNGHLSDCVHGGAVPCQWCDWAVITDDVTSLLTTLEDADLLLSSPVLGLTWALAAWSIAELPSMLTKFAVRDEARRLTSALCDAVQEKQSQILRVLTHESSMGGRLESSLKRVAALGSIPAMVREPDRWVHHLTGPVRLTIANLSERIEINRLQLICTFECEQLLTCETFHLGTVPELAGLHARRQTTHEDIFVEVAKGSFQELAIAALMSDLIEVIDELADALERTADMITITFSPEIATYPKQLRRTLWARCGIDWVHTFLDISGYAHWHSNGQKPHVALTTAWYVVAALAVSAHSGQIPATGPRRSLDDFTISGFPRLFRKDLNASTPDDAEYPCADR